MTLRLSRRAALAAALAPALAAPHAAKAQARPTVRFAFDWILNGPYAFGIAGERLGFFREAGVDITIQRGFGSARVPLDMSAGQFDIAMADPTPMLRFMSQNPNNDLIAVALMWDQAPTAVTVRADGPIRTPADLAGKTLAAPEFDGGRQVFPAFAAVNNIPLQSITWMSVSPELRETMLVQRRADAITGFVTSTALSLRALGMDLPQQRIFRYREHGLDFFYGSFLVTTRSYADRNPEAVRAVVAGMIRSLRWAFANRAEAIQHLRAREQLTDVAIETMRQDMAMAELVDSPNVRRLGLGVMEAPRFARQIEAVKMAFNLGEMPTPDRFYTDRFLPPLSERMLPAVS
ncbi:MAG: ABC transporter substrate-binding protein [Rhodovarius sp.]|nr:ABC transporter substrate-binding protein [Rhodovarius sp.]